MEVITAKSAGFCFGVRRAVDKVYELAKTGRNIDVMSFCGDNGSASAGACKSGNGYEK